MTHLHHADQAAPSPTWVRRLLGVLLITLGVVAVSIGSVFGISRAATTWHEVSETGAPGYLSLRTDQAGPRWQNLTAGDQINWQIEAGLQDAQSSSLELELRSDGQLVHAGDVTVRVHACTTEFSTQRSRQGPACLGGGVEVLPETQLARVAQPNYGNVFTLARLHTDSPRYLLVSLKLSDEADPDAIAQASMSLGVGLHARGDDATEATDHPRPPLAATGLDVAILILLGFGLGGLILGTYLVKNARRRS